MEAELSRRAFLKKALVLPAAAVLLAACGEVPVRSNWPGPGGGSASGEAPKPEQTEGPTTEPDIPVVPASEGLQAPPTHVPVIIFAEPNEERNLYHHAVINGRPLEAHPYLTLPFASDQKVRISEAWHYDSEQKITGLWKHDGIDYDTNSDTSTGFGVPLYAPCEGYAFASYKTRRMKNEDGTPKTYQDKEMGFGIGLHVQIYNFDEKRRNNGEIYGVRLGHLSTKADTIPFVTPTYNSDEESWYIVDEEFVFHQSEEELARDPRVVYIKQGEYIGDVGTSGIEWGKFGKEFNGSYAPIPQGEIWDSIHVHMNAFAGNLSTQRCIYDIYRTEDYYPDADNPDLPLGREPLLYLSNGKPVYAK